ncbi:MAG: NADPH-dependent FMN reductase [Magnetococcales bacterium]|nr:NADPH-dependent FMN reductase [Magnetococcales bacterium]
MKVLAFAASNSLPSINHQLVTYAASLLENAEVEILDISNFELPFYRPDREAEEGVPELAHKFYDKIGAADALLISLAEHNGSYTAAYKTLFDWTSRIDGPGVYQNKPTVLLSASPGKGGAKSVLGQAVSSAPHFMMDVKATFSLPQFNDNFDKKNEQVVGDYKDELLKALQTL